MPTIALDAWQEFIVDYKAKLGDCKAMFAHIPNQQSMDKEYSTYTIGTLSAGSTSDTLGFWRVKQVLMIIHTYNLLLLTDA